ncbi:hypothetical protein AB0B01_18765 [Streptomyces sp. NPDC044571]|uniref:hypothetical protein n=1 Tax=Streptomyces sp. NPDC044571 TaxID=3155371 RepID=UPI0033D64FD5
MYVRPRLLIASAVLAASLTACTGQSHTKTGSAAPAPSPTGTPSVSGTPAPTASPSASASASVQAQAPSSTPSAAAARPSAPAPAAAPATRPALSVDTAGGRLNLVRGGPAQEFTVTLRGGSGQAYRHLLVAFQMEPLPGSPGDLPGPADPYVLERRDPATGSWRRVDLRIATDVLPADLYEGGTALGQGAVRTERYRLRATVTGPTGSSPLMVYAVDTDHAEGGPAARSSLAHTTRRLV